MHAPVMTASVRANALSDLAEGQNFECHNAAYGRAFSDRSFARAGTAARLLTTEAKSQVQDRPSPADNPYRQ